MYFDYAQVVQLVKIPMKPAERKRGKDIRIAMAAALDELSMRLKSKSFLTSYSTSLSSATRETTLSGNNEDLRYLFALKIGSGSEERVMEFVEQQTFLRDHDNANEPSGHPTHWTQIKASSGYPIVRFNKPLIEAETLVVYHWIDMTPDNVAVARSMAAVAAGTQAYFYGLGTEQGTGYYTRFIDLAALARASDDFRTDPVSMRLLPRDDRQIMNVIRIGQLKRN